jgi:alpha-beta hydrolase superfamily lysophospholipase
MQASTSTQRAEDGTEIFVYRWAPDEGTATSAALHLVHGMAEHAARYARAGEALAKAGWVVYAHDQRGHGKTAKPGDVGHIGDVEGWRRALGDIRLLVAREKSEHAGVPFVLFGHSMGSFMVQELLAEMSNDLSGAVLSGTNGKPTPIAAAGRLVARAERARVGPRGHSPILRALSFDTFNKAFRPNRTAFDWLSRDTAEVDAYARDPLCGFECSTTTWVELLDALGRIADPSRQARIRKDLPVYVFGGADDPMSEKAKGVRQLLGAYERAGLRRVTPKLYEGARHEALNETNRDEVLADLVAWLRKEVAAK